MTKPDVILEVLRQMAVDATDATHLIERAYAAGLREGERTASANIAEALGSVLIDPDEGLSEQEAVEFLCQLHDDGELPAFVDHCRKQLFRDAGEVMRLDEPIDLDDYDADSLGALLGV